MPLFRNQKVNEKITLGIWRIEEPIEWLLENACLQPKELDFYQQIKNDTRRKQWLSVRVLLKSLLPDSELNIGYTNEKPHLFHSDFHISISHSGDYAAILVGNVRFIGIDIEKVSDKIDNLYHKFLGSEEIDRLEKDWLSDQLHIYWGAKEAMYKMAGIKGIEFSNQLKIEPFLKSISGKTKGQIVHPDFPDVCEIVYEKIGEYMLVYSSK